VSKFHGLIAEILLQRTKAEQVVPVFELFRRKYPSPHILARAPEKELLEVLYPLGLHWRARLISLLGKYLSARRAKIPDKLVDLIRIPGVGQYAASAFLCFHLDKRIAIVDSNVVRLYSRYFGLSSGPETRRNKEFIGFASALLPRSNFKMFNYALLDYTRTVCTPRPNCEACVFSLTCQYFNKGRSS